MLNFQVIGQTLIRKDHTELVENQYQYVYATFHFDIAWTSMNVSAIFEPYNKNEQTVPPPSQPEVTDVNNEDTGIIETTKSKYLVPIVHGVCIVPWEVVKSPSFTVSVTGFNYRTNITTNTITLGVVNNNLDPLPQFPPSILAYEACLALVNQYIEKADEYYKELDINKAEVIQEQYSALEPSSGSPRDVYFDLTGRATYSFNQKKNEYTCTGRDYTALETSGVVNTGSPTNLNVHQQQQIYTKSWWSTNNPTLMNGEIGVESDTKKFKFGDGVTQWNDLKYSQNNGAVALPRQPLFSDYDYDIGTVWVNINTWDIWILVYNADNSAKWALVYNGGVQ